MLIKIITTRIGKIYGNALAVSLFLLIAGIPPLE